MTVHRIEESVYSEETDKTYDITIEFTYSPGTPDVRYLPNGDPGYPGDPPEVEIVSVYSNSDDPVPLDFGVSYFDEEVLTELCMQKSVQIEDEADEEEADALYENAKQREIDDEGEEQW